MNVSGTDIIARELARPGYFFKAVMNESGVVFFPGLTQHNTVKVAGLSYEDNYKGNAMAAIVTEGRLEIRRHEAFSTARVAQIVNQLLGDPRLEALQNFRVTYQRDTIREGQASTGVQPARP